MLPTLAAVVWVAVFLALGGTLAAAGTFAVACVIFFWLPGNLFVGGSWRGVTSAEVVTAFVAGIAVSVTVYALCRLLRIDSFAWPALAILAFGGALRSLGFGPWRIRESARRVDGLSPASIAAGLLVMFVAGSAYWPSGATSADGMVFYGPMARDHIFHLALIERLTWHVPPDNFLVAGAPLSAYHFFSDLTQVLLKKVTFGVVPPLDIYFRLYPSLIYFCLGYLAFWVASRITASFLGGCLGVAMVALGADFTLIPGLARVLLNLGDQTAATERLFEPWCNWNSFGSTLPLIHRPAFYHGLLFLLAGCAIVQLKSFSRRSWMLAGLLWGLSAGFNYTFAAVLGCASLAALLIHLLKCRFEAAGHMATCAICILVGSLPVNACFLMQMPPMPAEQYFVWSPGSFAVARWAAILPNSLGGVALSITALSLLLLISYGPRLLGFRSMILARLRFGRHQSLALMMSLTTVISLSIGLLFEFRGAGGVANNMIYLQPTGWILGLFSLYPAMRVLRGARRGYAIAVCAVLVLTLVQSFAAFRLSYKVALGTDEVRAYEWIRAASDPSDVIAFWPGTVMTEPVLGGPNSVNNFFVPAMTGLRGYLSSDGYSKQFLESGDSAGDYQMRLAEIERVAKGDYPAQLLQHVRAMGVRWIVVPNRPGAIHPANLLVPRNKSLVVLDLARL